MKILITSYFFHPTPGGISTSTFLLAREFRKLGHEVRIVTTSPGGPETDPVVGKVIRAPSWLKLIREIAWADVVLSMHLSVRLTWPLLFNRRPWVIAHHSWITGVDGSVGWIEKIKLRLTRTARCISVSRAVADQVGGESVVIGPPHDDALFRPGPVELVPGDLLFVGRLVSSKGVSLLLQAVDEIRTRGRLVQLTVVGDGPELPALKDKTIALGLTGQIRFTGSLTGVALRNMFRSHRILVVPSITPETFGIVAIEAIACGCVVAGSDAAGGLVDAIGPCGPSFKTGSSAALASCVESLLNRPEKFADFRKHADRHVAQFTAERVAQKYLEVIESAFAEGKAPSVPRRSFSTPLLNDVQKNQLSPSDRLAATIPRDR